VFYAREEPQDVEIEFGRLFFEDSSCAIIEPISKTRAGAMAAKAVAAQSLDPRPMFIRRL
jgi:hypothetical protein